jgi:hypothetical protein
MERIGEVSPEAFNGLDADMQTAFEAATHGQVQLFIYQDPLDQ